MSQLNHFTLLEFCELNKYKIPRFCYHENLSIAGNCRMCLVELTTSVKPVASCAMSLYDIPKLQYNTQNPQISLDFFSIIKVDSWLVKKARESVLEFLLINHPLDCPICDQGGECDLQDQALLFGSDSGRFFDYKRATSDKNCGPLVKTIMTRCIHCTRCVRFANEVANISTLGITGRGSSMEIGFYIDRFLLSELSGNIIDLCPVGALTSKPYSFRARPWELEKFYTFDFLDVCFTPITIQIKNNEVFRILPRILEKSWITDTIRFSYDCFNNNRLLHFFTPLFSYTFLNLNFFFMTKLPCFKQIFFKTIIKSYACSLTNSFQFLVGKYLQRFKSNFFFQFNFLLIPGLVKLHYFKTALLQFSGFIDSVPNILFNNADFRVLLPLHYLNN